MGFHGTACNLLLAHDAIVASSDSRLALVLGTRACWPSCGISRLGACVSWRVLWRFLLFPFGYSAHSACGVCLQPAGLPFRVCRFGTLGLISASFRVQRFEDERRRLHSFVAREKSCSAPKRCPGLCRFLPAITSAPAKDYRLVSQHTVTSNARSLELCHSVIVQT